jgi:hypothetical protein
VTLKDKKTLAKADQAAIAELSTARVEKTGAVRAHVKMHSKQHALDALAKQLGIYGRGSKTIARAAGDAGEKRDANTILRAALEDRGAGQAVTESARRRRTLTASRAA